MPDPVTGNYGLILPTVGGDIGIWGGLVNSNLITFLDAFLGNALGVAVSNVDVTLTLSQWQNNGVFSPTGPLTANVNLILPLSPNSVGSATSVKGKFIINTTLIGGGNFKLTVKTAATGSVGVVVPPGGSTALYADGQNVSYADDTRLAKITPNAGDPNGAVAGNAGNAATGQGADVIWDTTNQQLNVSAGGTSWVKIGQAIPAPDGYLTPQTGVPIIGGDVTGVTTIFYTPYKGNQCPVYNGVSFSILPFAELPLALAAGSQLASGIYDVFAFISGGVLQVGFGPSWLGGATPGSVTPGACARGIGAASTALSRLNGLLVNTNNITLNNGASTFTPSALQATYLGSVFIDTTNGQVSCFRSWGQNRKFGIWNAYNRVRIILIGGDATTSWSYNSATWRQSNASANNKIQFFAGLTEEQPQVTFSQSINVNVGAALGIGLNSTTAPSGNSPAFGNQNVNPVFFAVSAFFTPPPLLGIQNMNMLEFGNSLAAVFSGTSALMQMQVAYMG